MSRRRKLVAIMFTDIAGYTALMQQSEGRALEIRNRHRHIFDRLTQQYRGEIIQYYGDGTLSIFDSAIEAVQCAKALQLSFLEEPAIPVRIGLHLGDIVIDEEDIIGDAVNIASRIESIAVVGSVLISKKILEEVKNHEEFAFKSLGQFSFKNVNQPIKVYALDDKALAIPKREEIGGKLEPTQKIRKLPSYANVFIGREYHIHAICTLFKEESTRLVSLLGPGGMGKTRLSVKIGESLFDAFEHGVCFVPLDVATKHEQVPMYMGHHLGLKENYENPLAEEIIDFLANKRLLLILDNLEQILGAAGFIAQIIESCPGVKILATSREILGLSHEIEYQLDSLNRPSPRLFPGPEDLIKFDAIDLFVQKAKISVPSFQLNEENAAAIVGICHELDGLPLPLELAAARLKLFSPELILNKLKSSTALLRTKSKDIVPRHQTIKNTVAWSYDLLSEEEQLLFQQLSMFRGGFTLESLETISPDTDAIEVVESFINKSLILKGKEVHDIARFKMLIVIREYGIEQLENNPNKDVYYQRFVNYFLEFVEVGEMKLRSPEQSKWIALFEAEYENIYVALEWLSNDQADIAAKIGTKFWRFHLYRGFLREGLEMVEMLLGLPLQEKRTIASLLEGAGSLSHNLGYYLKAKDYFEQALKICEEMEDKVEIAKALNNVGWAAWRIGDYAQTIMYSEKALGIFTGLHDDLGRAKSLNNIAWAHFYQGFYEKAEQIYHEVLAIHEKGNNERGIAFAKVCLGWALLYNGNKIEAEHLINEGIAVFEHLQNLQMIAFSGLIKAELLFVEEELEAARDLLEMKSLLNFENIGDVWGIASAHYQLGELYLKQENQRQAKIHLDKSLGLFQKTRDKFGEVRTSILLSRLNRLEGSVSPAGKLLDRAIQCATSMGAHQLLKDSLLDKALCVQEQDAALAVLLLAYADHYAEKLGEYMYDQFQLQLSEKLGGLKKLKTLNLSSMYAEAIDQDASLLAMQLETIPEQELLERMQTLVEAFQLEDQETSGTVSVDQFKAVAEDPFLRQVSQIVENRLHEHDFTVEDLCQEIGMSHSQVHRKLKALTDQSISKFIQTSRLEKAKELLLNPKLIVAAVAYDSGFKDPDYFYRIFKKSFGVTPKAYRNAEINKH